MLHCVAHVCVSMSVALRVAGSACLQLQRTVTVRVGLQTAGNSMARTVLVLLVLLNVIFASVSGVCVVSALMQAIAGDPEVFTPFVLLWTQLLLV